MPATGEELLNAYCKTRAARFSQQVAATLSLTRLYPLSTLAPRRHDPAAVLAARFRQIAAADERLCRLRKLAGWLQ